MKGVLLAVDGLETQLKHQLKEFGASESAWRVVQLPDGLRHSEF